MNEPWDWDQTDILRLIYDQVRESLTLDYKTCDALQKTDGKKKEISKDVSSFANSAGGVIIYGVKENGHVPTAIDCGYDPSDISKEWLEQVINSRINRRIDGIRINPISLSGSKSGRVIYIVAIPQSLRAPHMAGDKRFYKRFNFEAVPMEEYEVRDVSRRLAAPDLFLSFTLTGGPSVKLSYAGSSVFSGPIETEIVVGNNSPAPADFCLLSYYIDSRLNPSWRSEGGDNFIECGGNTIAVCSHVVEWRGNLRLPIWEGVRFQISVLSLRIPKDAHQFFLFWKAQAPLMSPKAGVYALEVQNGTAAIYEHPATWQLQKEIFRKV